MCLLTALSLTELTANAKLQFPGHDDTISDYCAGIYNCFLGIGQTLGPIFGSYSDKLIGFRLTQTVVSLISFAFILIIPRQSLY